MEKADAIKEVVLRLSDRFGAQAFDIVDHWNNDQLAIGVAQKQNPAILVYITTRDNSAGRYFVELELPPDPDIDFPYTVAGRYNSIDFAELVQIVARHLNLIEE